MSKATVILIGVAAIGGVFLATRRSSTPAPGRAPTQPTPTGVNDFVRGYLPPALNKYFAPGGNGPTSAPKSFADYSGAAKATSELLKPVVDKWVTGKPGTAVATPSDSNVDWNNPAMLDDQSDDENTGNPIDFNTDQSPDLPEIPDDAPDDTVFLI